MKALNQKHFELWKRKHPDFRGISERGLEVLVYRNGTTLASIESLTPKEISDLGSRSYPVTAEERRDAKIYGFEFPRLRN